jgi:hypothetical protein
MASEAEAPATPLFRNEALRFQAARLQGEVFLKIRSPWLVLGFVCAALAIIVVVAAALVSYERKEQAAGSLVFVEGRVEARLRIAPAAIGFIRRGQPVRLSFDAFPVRQFGLGQGKIAAISLLPDADGFYLARVELERDYMRVANERIALRPGMALTGSIVIERRPMLESLFKPLQASGASHEP